MDLNKFIAQSEWIEFFQEKFDNEMILRLNLKTNNSLGKPKIFLYSPDWDFEQKKKRIDYKRKIYDQTVKEVLEDQKFRDQVIGNGYTYEMTGNGGEIAIREFK